MIKIMPDKINEVLLIVLKNDNVSLLSGLGLDIQELKDSLEKL
jgi:hypothetical protein